MTKTKRLFSWLLVLALCLELLPPFLVTEASAAPEQTTYTGDSYLSDQDLERLGLDTSSTSLKNQAEDDLSPYGNGITTLVPNHELMVLDKYWASGGYLTDTVFDDPLKGLNTVQPNDFGLGSSNTRLIEEGAVAARSVAFDALGNGKNEFVAMVYAVYKDGRTTIKMRINSNQNYGTSKVDGMSNTFVYSMDLAVLPFEVYPENAGAYLSITAGNFDGDEAGTQEIAVYRPFHGDTYSGTVDIMKVEKRTVNTCDLYIKYSMNLRSQSSYYFYDNASIGRALFENIDEEYPQKNYWGYMYRIPSVSLEAVTQPESAADDICITYSPAMYGNVGDLDDVGPDWDEGSKVINPTRPYDSATAVFFWIDPLTQGQKRTGSDQMRWNWKNDYNVSDQLDDEADEKWEVMTFGGAGAGDINGDGSQEVVIAGWVFKERKVQKAFASVGSVSAYHWDFADDELLATYYTYDAKANTYRRVDQCGSWVSIKPDDYDDTSDIRDGIYTNQGGGGKDQIHPALDVTCFAERGTGYGESVFMGGIVTRLETQTGVSAMTPHMDKGLGNYGFDYGTLDGLYAIPTSAFKRQDLGGITFSANYNNALFTESVAGNFNGNTFGQEQLAFAWTAKYEGERKFNTFYGVIGQKNPGDDIGGMENDKDKLGHVGIGLVFQYRRGLFQANKSAMVTVAAVDVDDDSILMRRSTKKNKYFFSDPEIIAVLQAAPYFKDIDYGSSNGTTSFVSIKGSSSEMSHGVDSSISVQVGAVAVVALGAVIGGSTYGGVHSEFSNTWGEGSSKTFSLEFTNAEENCVALVMSPIVRYYYEVLDPETGKWNEMEVDVSQVPRASMVTVEEYDQVALEQGWELIGDNILKNKEGVPTSYASTSKGLKDFYGGSNEGYGIKQDENYGSDNFLRVGRSSGSYMSQSISTEQTKTTSRDWSVLATYDDELIFGSVGVRIGAELGYTGSKTTATFAGFEYTGTVTNLPKGSEEYSFSWQFGHWTDSLTTTSKVNGKDVTLTHTFPVLGYLVTGVQQPIPAIQDPMLHVYRNDTDALTLAWMANEGAVQTNYANTGYLLARRDSGIWYAMAQKELGEAVNGVLTFKDEFVDPDTRYEYALIPYAQTGNGMLLGNVMSPTTAATQPEPVEDLPRITDIVSTELSNGKVRLTAGYSYGTEEALPPAGSQLNFQLALDLSLLGTGPSPFQTTGVGAAQIQWQQYLPEQGGWIDLPAGFGVDQITVPAMGKNDRYRFVLTQRIDNRIYSVFAEASRSGTVFLASMSNSYRNWKGETVMDFVLVDEDGQVEIVTASGTGFSTRHVYTRVYDGTGGLNLSKIPSGGSLCAVTNARSNLVQINGGSTKNYAAGKDLRTTEESQVWDVNALIKRLCTSPLLAEATTAREESVMREDLREELQDLVKKTTLKADDWISYTYGGNNASVLAATSFVTKSTATVKGNIANAAKVYVGSISFTPGELTDPDEEFQKLVFNPQNVKQELDTAFVYGTITWIDPGAPVESAAPEKSLEEMTEQELEDLLMELEGSTFGKEGQELLDIQNRMAEVQRILNEKFGSNP